MTASLSYRGPWSPAEVRGFLTSTTIPLRLAANTPSGFPVVLSLWFVAEGDQLLGAVHESSRIAKRLEADPRCAFEVAPDDPPYRGVRGRARATLEPDGAGVLLERLLERYLGSTDSNLGRFLLSRASEERVVRVSPLGFSSWDYTERMDDALRR
ncbi:MAG: pyridoxamine 5'-phosphate oxidase family protein [Myxococcota bacterium]